MTDDQKVKHEKTKKVLKIVGICLIVVGAICTIVGMANFFMSMGGDEMPKLFFLCFLGIPMLAVGVFLTIFAHQKEIQRYIKNESVPVFNEFGKEASPGVEAMAEAVKDGLTNESTDIKCPYCGESNDCDSKFCKSCGKSIITTCPSCGKEVDGNSKFCNHCGAKLD